MNEYKAEDILQCIREHLLRELGLDQGVPIGISSRQRHKHSDSMVLELGEGNPVYKVFVKYGAHFSGVGGWDIKSEYEGYALVHKMDCDQRTFFSVRPLLFMEEPKIIATIFVQGRMLQDIYKQSLMRFRNRKQLEKSLYFTRLIAQWLVRFLAETEETRKPVKGEAVLSFCKDRFQEISRWSPSFREYGISSDLFIPFLYKVLHISPADRVRVVRNHGDFAPHNVLIDSKDRLGVIDIGFTVDKNNPLLFEDAATYLIYLEQMRTNPIYRSSGLEIIIKTFLTELLGEDPRSLREFMAAYIKKNLAHIAWLYHPDRKPVSRWAEYSFRKWGRDRLKWLSRIIGERGTERRSIYDFLYHL